MYRNSHPSFHVTRHQKTTSSKNIWIIIYSIKLWYDIFRIIWLIWTVYELQNQIILHIWLSFSIHKTENREICRLTFNIIVWSSRSIASLLRALRFSMVDVISRSHWLCSPISSIILDDSPKWDQTTNV